jgi:hypothetical protein
MTSKLFKILNIDYDDYQVVDQLIRHDKSLKNIQISISLLQATAHTVPPLFSYYRDDNNFSIMPVSGLIYI